MIKNLLFKSIKNEWIKLVVILVYLFPQHTIAAFGETCVSPNSQYYKIDKLNDLANDSLLGYVKSLVDVKDCGGIGKGCTPKSDNFTFCIKNTVNATNNNADTTNSRQVSLNINLNTEISNSVKLSDIAPNNLNLLSYPTVGDVILTARKTEDQICLTTPSVYGAEPLACIATINSSDVVGNTIPANNQCLTVSNACAFATNNITNSQFNPSFSGRAIQCFYESFDMMFLNPQNCSTNNDVSYVTNLKTFALFQEGLKTSVAAALILYIILLGIKMILKPGETNPQELFISITKIILVLYFSVGLNPSNWYRIQENKTENGMSTIVLPFMRDFTNEFASYFANNSFTNNLCKFDSSDYSTDKYYALWDAIDCRLSIYFGTTKLLDDTTLNTNGLPNDLQNKGPIRIFALMFSIILSGNIILFLLLGVMGLIMFGLVLNMISTFVISIMMMYLLVYIAPIFIPMSLFRKTEGYFRGWLNLCIGTVLQPIIIITFGAFILSISDNFIFNNCAFSKLIDHDTGKYIFQFKTPDDLNNGCQNSIGYMIYASAQSGAGWEEYSSLFFNYQKYNDIYGLEGSLWSAFAFFYLMRFFLSKINQFAQGLSGGLSLSGAVVQADLIYAAGSKMSEMKKNIQKSFENVKG